MTHTHMEKKVEFRDPSERSPFKNRLIYDIFVYIYEFTNAKSTIHRHRHGIL